MIRRLLFKAKLMRKIFTSAGFADCIRSLKNSLIDNKIQLNLGSSNMFVGIKRINVLRLIYPISL